jgi:acyl-CoA thioesterase I
MIKYFFGIFLLILSACGSDTPIVTFESTKTEKTILALGDSLTAGYGLIESDSYPSQLEVKLREKSYNYKTINA